MVPVLSVLPGVVQSQFIEQGLYVVAFHPQFSENGYFFVHYASVRLNGSGVIARFQLDPHSPDHVRLERIAATEKHILTIEQPSYNNNSGQIAFGPDGLLYVGVGDGGWKAPRDAGQDASLLLGSILRIDINTKDNVAYKMPANNSLIGKPGRVHQEIWAHGFHRATSNTSCDVTGNLPVALNPHPKVGAAPKAHDSGFVCASAQGLSLRGLASLIIPVYKAFTCSLIGALARFLELAGMGIAGNSRSLLKPRCTLPPAARMRLGMCLRSV